MLLANGFDIPEYFTTLVRKGGLYLQIDVFIMSDNYILQLVIYPYEDGHAIGFIVPATASSPERTKGLLRFPDLARLENHGYKILEYVKKVREGGIPQEVFNSYKDDDK
jgi:hypothetical protein